MPADKTEELYAEALELAGYNALALKAMCLWAYEHIKDKAAMKAASAAWGRNARNFAKAVDYFGEFGDCTTDDILSIVAISSLPFDAAEKLYGDMRASTLTYWQVRERVAAAKPKRERKPSDWEQVAELVTFQRSVGGYKDGDRIFNIIETLAAIPSAAKVLKNGEV